MNLQEGAVESHAGHPSLAVFFLVCYSRTGYLRVMEVQQSGFTPSTIRFSVVDDDAAMRQSLSLGLERLSDFICVGSYASGAEALAGIPRTPGDVVLMDIRMPRMSGIECTRQLKILLPELPILMLTGFADHATVREALMAGASGYLKKPFHRDECAQALRKAVQGGAPLCPEASLAVVSAFRGARAAGPGQGLSQRERDLLLCLFEELADKEIAERLGITSGTVHVHLRNLYKKLEVNTRAEAVRKYLNGQSGS